MFQITRGISTMEFINETPSCKEIVPANVTVEHLYTSFEKVIILGFIPLVTLIGLLGNGTLLYSFYRNHAMRTTTNIYLGNLAVADGTLLIVGTHQWVWTYVSSPIYYNYSFAFSTPFGCAFTDFLVYLSYFASVFLVSIVTFERYLAVCRPLRQYQNQGNRRAIILCASAWCCSIVMASFRFPQWPAKYCLLWPDNEPQYLDYPKTVHLCSERVHYAYQITYYSDTAQFLLAVSVVCFASISMVLQLKQRLTTTLTDDATREQFVRDKNKITAMLITNAVIFFLCLTPFQILNLESLFIEIGFNPMAIEASTGIAWIGRFTTHINSAVNPIIYSVVHERYRRAAYEAWTCQEPQRRKVGGCPSTASTYTTIRSKCSYVRNNGKAINQEAAEEDAV